MSDLENKMTEQESLNLISETINKVKTSYYEKGIGPILWGCIITVCSLVSFYASKYNIYWLYNVWFLTIIAVLPQIIITAKERKEKKFVSFTDAASGTIWITFGFSMMVLSILENVMRIKYNWGMHSSVYMLVYGIPTIITGLICKIKPMVIGGIFCWVFAIASTFVPYPYPLLFMATSAIVAWLIPGLLINSKYRKHKAANV
jgi:hypothetical protein